MKIDEVRLLDGLNTQTRNLKVLSFLLNCLNKKTLPIEILKRQAIEWSIKLEKSSLKYRNSTGKLTEKNRVTKAFLHYIDLLVELGLITRINQVVRNTKYGLVFNLLKSKSDANFNETYKLADFEVLFFFYTLLKLDADGLITILKIIHEKESGLKEIDVRERFAKGLQERFRSKAVYSSGKTKMKSEELYRNYEIRKLSIGRYSFKHQVPNRLKWLVDLGLLFKSGNFYLITNLGKEIYENLPSIKSTKIKDINEDWINNKSWIFFTKKNNKKNIKQDIGGLLMDVFNFFGDDGSLKISLDSAYLYTAIFSASFDKKKLSFNDFIDLLNEEKVKFDNKIFAPKISPRQTESYINIYTK